jgi:hypothetical protein
MASTQQAVRVYRELAELYDRQGEQQMRDRFLVLAADAALANGMKEEAERLRQRLLQQNPHHLLKPYANFTDAMRSRDVQNYVTALRRSHPYEKAEHLLETMRTDAAPPAAGATPEVLRLSDTTPKVARTPPPGGDKPVPAARPRPVETFGLRNEPVVSRPARLATDADSDEAAGAWVSLGLFLLVLLGGVALAGYTLVYALLHFR